MVKVPAIVTPELFESAKKHRRRNRHAGIWRAKHNYLLSGHVRCAHCGFAYQGSGSYRTNGDGERRLYLYYRHGYDVYGADELDCKGYFPADKVDAVVWGWVKSFLTDPKAMAEGLRMEKGERERASEPLRNRLAVIDDLIADNQKKLERAIDLYLAGDFLREMLTERKERLQTTIEKLEREQADLVAQLEARILTDEQVQTITEFAAKVRGGLEAADRDFEKRRRLIELLDVQVTLAVENGEKVVYAQCVVGEEVLSVASTNTVLRAPPSAGPGRAPSPHSPQRSHRRASRFSSRSR